MEYEQKPFTFQRTKLIATADEVNCHWQSRRIGNLSNLFSNLWHFDIPCKPRHQTVTLIACVEWTFTWTNNWILHLYGHCSFLKTGIANSSFNSCVSILDPWVLILAYQNSNNTTVRRRESSVKDLFETVNLPLSHTAYRFSSKMKKEQEQLNVFRVSLVRWFIGVEVVMEGRSVFSLHLYFILTLLLAVSRMYSNVVNGYITCKIWSPYTFQDNLNRSSAQH